MDPTVDDGRVLVVSDEHLTFQPGRAGTGGRPRPGLARARRSDVAYHERMQVIDGEDVVESWPVDLRGW